MNINKLFTIVTIALIIIIAYAFYTAVDVFAMGNGSVPTFEYSNGCVPYTHAIVVHGSTWHSHTIVLQHGSCAGTPANKQDNDTVSIVPVADVAVTDNTKIVLDTPTQPVVTNDTPVVSDQPEPVVSEQGNPGNLKPVGNAGENPNGKDTMPLDNAGGNGNGEHGNQGVNH